MTQDERRRIIPVAMRAALASVAMALSLLAIKTYAAWHRSQVAIHDDQGQRIHLKRDGIEIQAKKVTVTSDGEVTVNSDSVKLGNGADAALVRWPEFLSYMSGLSLPVTGACQVVVPPSPTPIVGTITGTATPPTPPPSTAMATTTVKAK